MKLLLKGLFIACLFTACAPHEVYVVKERPREVVYVRPAPPGPNHIWISGDWVWENGNYRWHEGHWEHRREGMAWREGHWQETSRGWKWIPGHWA